jgi:hypothetical protein
MKNNARVLWLLVAILALSSSVAFGQSLRGKRMGDVSYYRFATATILNPDSALPAGVYTVGQGGSFPTIDSAFNKLNRDGVLGPVTLTLIDTLYEVLHGRRFELGPIAGTGPASRVTIRPAVGTNVTIRGDSDAVFYFQGVKYLTLDGRSNPPSTSSGIFVHALDNPAAAWNDCIDVWGDADYNQFLSLALRSDDPGSAAGSFGACLSLMNLGVDTPDSNLIEGNTTRGTTGFWITGSMVAPYVRPQGNIIRGNTVGEPSDLLGAWGITSEFAAGTIIEENTVQFLRRAMLPNRTSGIVALGGDNIVIRNNVVHSLSGAVNANVQGITGYGSATYGGHGLKIYNNMVYDLQNTSTTGNGYMGGIVVWWHTDVQIAYNTVLLSGTGANPIGTDALGFDVEVYNATIRNNILVNLYHQTAGGGCTALFLEQATTFTTDYNDLYVDTTFANSATVVHWNVNNYRTLSNWQTTGRDAHSLSIQPVFRSATDLHIDTLGIRSQWVPLANTGIAVAGCEWDIDGDNRVVGNNPDIGADEFWISPNPPTGVEQIESELPQTFSLAQNYPNPFNPVTNIQFSIVNRQLTVLKVYDVLGREVATLVNEVKQPGTYTVQWDASRVASGVYLCRLSAGEYTTSRKVMLLR